MPKVIQLVKGKNDNHHKENEKANDVFLRIEKLAIFTL